VRAVLGEATIWEVVTWSMGSASVALIPLGNKRAVERLLVAGE
jgi:hypothetical protein